MAIVAGGWLKYHVIASIEHGSRIIVSTQVDLVICVENRHSYTCRYNIGMCVYVMSCVPHTSVHCVIDELLV